MSNYPKLMAEGPLETFTKIKLISHKLDMCRTASPLLRVQNNIVTFYTQCYSVLLRVD